MGLFKKIKKAVQKVVHNPVKAVTNVAKAIIKDPARAGLAYVTFGGSEIARQVPGVGNLVKQGTALASTVYKTAANVYTGGLYGAATGAANMALDRITVQRGGGGDVALNIGGLLGQIGGIFGGNQNQYFQGVSNVASLASNFFPPRGVPQGPAPTASPAVLRLPGAGAAAGAVATVGRSFFNKYPNLATAIQSYRNQGKHVTRAKLWSLVKRFGPEIVISGGILSAAAVNELMVAGAGHRRMNPANVKALRKSLRRLESFHTLCQKVDKLRRPRSRGKKSAGSGSTFVRQG